ncbi:MAG: 4-alpha-glucanotransferase [Kofleriaceae bacterium]|nr:4-alpha-glucanotransferase [Kofleriaceae bacterium]
MTDHQADLLVLATLCGIDTEYVDGLGRAKSAQPDVIIKVLQALGIEIQCAAEARAILDDRTHAPQRILAPCIVGSPENSIARLCGIAGQRFEALLRVEDGITRNYEGALDEEGGYAISLGELPPGYHDLDVHIADSTLHARVLVAPARAYGAPDGSRAWGFFCPTYALRHDRDWGIGDLAALGRMMDWARQQGASFLGTVPLLAANYREDFQTSPYSPMSRLFWNEIYLDIDSLQTQYDCPALRTLLKSAEHKAEGLRLRELQLVDYAAASAHKRAALWCIAEEAWQKRGESLTAILEENSSLRRYAEFRAAMEASGRTWHSWQKEQRAGTLSPADYDLQCFRYHAFVQIALEEEFVKLADKDCTLYLDLSVGAAGSSYDVWNYSESFTQGVDVGAPPDGLFEGGQNWALPPLHPQASRERGHDYFIECVRTHMRHAGMLRIDHVMGLHRLYWIPSGVSAAEGVYVRYPADELYAILRIESHRNSCALVGEDLGTVPGEVRPMMAEFGMHRLYVGQFSVDESDSTGMRLSEPPVNSIASLGTHDTATVAGWFDESKIRDVNVETLMRGWTEQLAASSVAGLLINLEDLWLEREPQNRPGTGPEMPNWRHKMVRDESAIHRDVELREWLATINRLRAAKN